MSISKKFVVLLFSAMFIGVGLYMRGKERKVESYVETVGTVKESRVISNEFGGKTRYRPEILYSYEVDGKTYEGNRYAYVQTSYGFESGAEKVVKKYPAGTACKVHYNQEEPWSSVLVKREKGIGGWMSIIFIGIGALIAAGTLLGVFSR